MESSTQDTVTVSVPMSREAAIMSILNSETHSRQQDVWRADIKLLHARQGDTVEDVRRLRYEFYKIAAICLVFQGVILTAVSQASCLTCPQAWSPVLLSAVVAISATFAAADKISDISDGEEEYLKFETSIKKRIEALENLENEGDKLKLENYKKDKRIEDIDMYNYDIDLGSRRSVLGWTDEAVKKIMDPTYFTILLFLLAFSVVVEWLSYKALCDGTAAAACSPAPSSSR